MKNVRRRLEERRSKVSLDGLRARAGEAPRPRDMVEALRRERESRIRVIAEIKKASPSKGVIRPDFDPVEIAREYEENGASAVSVLTEEDAFLGRPEYLSGLRGAVALPLLRKDFILDPYQVVEARALGADAFLLIACLLTGGLMEELIRVGEELGMAALVEVHNADELERVLQSPARLIGINNRDLATFATDVGTTFRLRPRIPADRTVVSESGIASAEDLRRLEGIGVDAALVGEVLMRAPHPGEKLRELLEGPGSRGGR